MQLPIEERLLEADIPTAAFFRLQIRIAVEVIARTVVDEELVQRRSLEAGAVARLQLGLRTRDDEGGRDPVGRMPAIAVIVVAADIGGKEEAILDIALILQEGGLVAVGGRQARRLRRSRSYCRPMTRLWPLAISRSPRQSSFVRSPRYSVGRPSTPKAFGVRLKRS